MKNTALLIGVCTVLLLMPALAAVPTLRPAERLASSLPLSDGTFAGGMGRGHWGNGNFNIDTVYAYMSGVYTSGGLTRISGDITNTNGQKIGEISVYFGSKIVFGHTKNLNGVSAPLFGYLMKNQNRQFVGRIMSTSMPVPHMWGYLIPNL